MRALKLSAVAGVLALGVFVTHSPNLQAADHIDYTAINVPANNQVDIADLYAFDNGANAVFVLTVSPLAAAGSNNGFDDAAQYRIVLSDDLTPGDVIKVRTSGNQVRVTGPDGLDIQGAQGTNLSGSLTGGGTAQFYAGPAEDPFFIDLAGLQATLTAGSDMFTGADTTGGTNVSAIVLEIPKASLGTGTKNVWAVTVR